MISIYWSSLGIHAVETLSSGKKFNSLYFKDIILQQTFNSILNKKQKSKKENYYSFWWWYPSQILNNKIESDENEVYRTYHLLYSINLTPKDFYLNEYWKEELKRRSYLVS
jgi:hypothetical protein